MFTFSIAASLILYFCPPGPTPAPGGIGLGGKCGSATVAPHSEQGRTPHSEQGRLSK